MNEARKCSECNSKAAKWEAWIRRNGVRIELTYCDRCQEGTEHPVMEPVGVMP